MINFLVLNTMALYAVILFAICVIIGFFGDIYMRKNNKIGNIFDFNKNEKNTSNQENKKSLENDVSVDNSLTSDTTITDNNLNNNQNTVDMRMTNNILMDQNLNDGINNLMNEIPVTNNNLASKNIFDNATFVNNNNSNVNENNNLVNKPVPFDGNVQNDEQVNNMF